jgi:hypothetical protein
MDIKATFFRFKPRLTVEPIQCISDQALLDEILQNPEFSDSKQNLNADVFLEVPSDLSDLNITPKLKRMLDKFKGQIICIST